MEKIATPIPEANASSFLVCSASYELNSNSLAKNKNFATSASICRYISNQAIYHKFIITGGSRYYKDYVLKLLIEAAHPNELIPVKYVKQEPDAYFYARSCSNAIDKFCRDGLVVTNPHGENIQIRIILNSVLSPEECEVNMHVILSSVIRKRFNESNNALNLKDFHNDPDLVEFIFCPLSHPRVFEFVMGVVKRVLAGHRFNSVSLANNELSVMKTLEALPSTCLRQLNLSYNKFDVVEDLTVLRSVPLVDLNLDNNPLCQQFDDEVSYVAKIRQYLPQLTKLDTVKINELGIPLSHRNCLVSGDGGPLTDQFLQHYFDLYDGSNRRKLYGVYNTQAQFSLTATYLPMQSTSATSQLSNYLSHSRNLLKLSNYAKAHQMLYQGQEKIIELLCQLPPTEHDPHSFAVDLPLYTKDSALISVTGVFRDSSLIRSFHRTFLLHRAVDAANSNEWQIVNEMLHVSNAPTDCAGEAFKIPRTPIVDRPTILDPTEKMQMTEIVAQITDMKPEFAEKCLKDCNWNLEEALTVFRELYKERKIPKSAFHEV